MKKELGQKISIPGNQEGILAEMIDLSRVEGDIVTRPDFELTGQEPFIDSLRKGPAIRETLGNGGRVFITEADDLLFVGKK